jgi:hypothetical protein
MQLEGFIGPSYTLEAPSAGSQRLVNLYPELHEAGPRKGNVARLKATPGLRLRGTLGDGPIRGIHRASTGQVFAVSGSSVYEVFSHWDGRLRSGSLSTSSGRVTMADDGTRLVIGDGSTSAFQVPLALGSAAVAIGGDCPGGHVAWQDGYFIHTVPNTGRFAISGLNAITYDALDTATAEGRPDQLVAVISVNRQVWLFGKQTTEVWWNSGDELFPFARNESAFIETGTVSAGTCVRAGGSVVWVGSDERGRGTVWHAQGTQPVRISTHAIELALSGYSRLAEASAFSYQQGGHEFYQLSVPDGGTWVYDFATGLWHERSYLSETGEEPHRAWVGTVGFSQVVVGDREDGRIYTYDTEFYFDDDRPIRRLRQGPAVSQEEKRIVHKSFELQAQMGVGLVTGQGSAPVVALQWSDDGGATWGNEHQTSLGAIGQYANRARWTRLGAARDRVYRVIISDPVPVTLLGAEINPVELGS